VRIIAGIIGLTSVLFSFTGCFQRTEKEQIVTTSTAVIDAIRKGDSSKFDTLLSGLDTMARGTIGRDFALYRKYIQQYWPLQNPPIEITDLFNTHRQLLVKIRIFRDPVDSLIKKGDLRLLFGAANEVPLSKISGYEVQEMDLADSINYHPWSYWQRPTDPTR
jgi:hypothetical protein